MYTQVLEKSVSQWRKRILLERSGQPMNLPCEHTVCHHSQETYYMETQVFCPSNLDSGGIGVLDRFEDRFVELGTIF